MAPSPRVDLIYEPGYGGLRVGFEFCVSQCLWVFEG